MKNVLFHIALLLLLSLFNLTDCFSQYAFESKKAERTYLEMEDYYSEGDYASILDKEKDYLKLFEEKKDTLSALVYSFLAEAYLYWEGDLEKSLDFYQKEYDLRKQIGDTEGNDTKNVIFMLGYLNDELGNYNKTEELYEQLLKIDEETFGRKSEEYYMTAYALVEHYIYIEDGEKGIDLIKQLEQIVERNSFEDAMVSKAYGDLLQIKGSYKKAESELVKAIEIMDDLGLYATIEYVGILNSLGGLYTEIGKIPESEAIYDEALSIIDRLPGDNTDYELAVKSNLGRVYTSLANYDLAESIFKENLKLDEELYGEYSFFYALDAYNLALNDLYAGNYNESEEYHMKALEIFKEIVGEESIDYARVLNNLTLLYTKTRELEKAIDYGQQSIIAFAHSVGNDHQQTSFAEYNLGDAYLIEGEMDKAEKLHTDALRIRRNTLGRNHPVYAKSTNKMAIINWGKNNLKEAISYYDDTFENYFNQINTVFPILSEAEKTKFYYNNLKPTFEQYNAFIVKSSVEDRTLVGKMYDYQLAIKGLIFYASNKVRDAIINSNDSVLINNYEQWIEMKEQTAKLLSATDISIEVRNEMIDSLAVLSNELERELSKSSGTFAETFVQKKLSWKDIQKELKPDEAAIEVIRFRDFTPDSAGVFTDEVFYAALIVTQETKDQPDLVVMRNGLLMETRYLANYRNAIKYKVEEDFSYRLFWRPIANRLEGIKKVYFSPDGVFNQISLYTLKNPDSQNYIIDEIEIRLMTNTKDLLAVNLEDGKKGPSFLFGFPNYNMGIMEDQNNQDKEGDEARSLNRSGPGIDIEKLTRGGSIPRGLRGNLLRYMSTNNLLALLPGTQIEVKKIDSLYQDLSRETIIYTSNEALEDNIKKVQSPEVLHIATHGFFLENTALGDDEASDEYVENPLLRSGLILAGANSYIIAGQISDSLSLNDDGILTAYEAMNLHLDNTDLVVLSACETGLGVVKNGEGVYGMQRAFQVAGAEAVIMSMWTVDDAATQELMTNFYEEWLGGKGKQESFIEAQKKLKEKWRSPYYWGAFVMVGG
ncbi:MAG: CHAT domain-containing protein [Bacteroidota bacterium]